MLKTQVESSRLPSQGQRVAGSAMGLTSILRSRDSIHPFSFCLGLTQMCIVSTHSHTSPSMHIYAQTHILTHPTAHSHVHTHVTHSRGHTCTYMYLPHTLPYKHTHMHIANSAHIEMVCQQNPKPNSNDILAPNLICQMGLLILQFGGS